MCIGILEYCPVKIIEYPNFSAMPMFGTRLRHPVTIHVYRVYRAWSQAISELHRWCFLRHPMVLLHMLAWFCLSVWRKVYFEGTLIRDPWRRADDDQTVIKPQNDHRTPWGLVMIWYPMVSHSVSLFFGRYQPGPRARVETAQGQQQLEDLLQPGLLWSRGGKDLRGCPGVNQSINGVWTVDLQNALVSLDMSW